MKGHEIYTAADFTRMELARRNGIAVAVIEEGAKICKKCGDEGEQLLAPCVRSLEGREARATARRLT